MPTSMEKAFTSRHARCGGHNRAMAWPFPPGWRAPDWRPLWRWLSRSRLRLLGIAALALLAVLVVTVAIYSSLALARFERVEERRTTFVYAGAQPLVPGVHVRRVDLAGTLARLKYADSRGAVPAPGQFRRVGSAWEINLRGAPGAGPQRVRLETRDERITSVTRDGYDIGAAALEPEVLTSADDRPGEDHRPVRLAEVPLVLINAVLAAEDHRFFEHGGLDARGLLRAAWANLRAGRVMQGGSTITQQLVKNRLVGSRRTLFRKANEAWLATLVEWRYSKPQILEAYLNEVYLGQPHGPMVLARPIIGARQHFRLEGGGADVVAVARDARDPLVARLEPDALRARPRRPAQVDLPGATDAPELAGRRHRPAGVGVFQAGQRAGQVHAPHVDTGNQWLGAGVHERGAALLDPLEACQGQRGVGGDRGSEDGEEGEGGDPQQPQAAA